MYKNYFTAFIFIFLSLLLTGISCKKVQTGIPDNSNGSRLTSMSTTYHMPGHTYKILETFVYNANKISHYEKNEDDFLYKISEYTYQNNLAIEKTKLYSETDLVQVDSTIFECNNKKLKRISNWRNSDTLWRLVKDANFLYNGDQEITYLDTLDQTNKEKGTSTFENGKLIQYELCFFSEWINTWSIAYRQDFKYEYGKIKEQIVTTSNNSTKYIYNYIGERINKIDVYQEHNFVYELTYYNEYFYDNFGNLITDKCMNSYDQSLYYTIEYQYEEGFSNIQHVSYYYYSFPGMQYPCTD